MTAAARIAAVGGPVSVLARFRGALVGAVVGDCVGGEFEGAEDVPLDRVLQHLSGLEDETRGDGILQYSDDTAMMRCVAHSLLTRTGFDEQDMARRFAKEYSLAPGRGYGSGVIQVLRKLASPHLSDVFQPARAQFGGRGSFGNGGAMRAAPFALAFRNAADVRQYTKLGAMLTHSCTLGYNGAVLQALAVHLSLQGALAWPQEFINKLISEMEEVEKEETAQRDAKALNLAEFPYCTRLHRIKELIERGSVSIEEVISELEKQSEATTPARKGNLTGSARKLKDNAADWHNLILKWDRLSDEGSAIATKIVNYKISERSVKEPDVVVEVDRSSVAPPERKVHQNNQELEEECNKLQNIVDKLAHILSKMEKMVSAERGICELEKFQYGEKGRPEPLFYTWSTQEFAEVSSRLYEAYKQELALKRTILQELAHTTNTDLSMVYLSAWLYQPYIEDSTKLLLEGLLLETGHRAL